MAYYAALVSLLELLKEISHHDRYSESHFDKAQIASLHVKFKLLQELLDTDGSADILEGRIRDAACKAQDLIENHISNPKRGDLTLGILAKEYQELEDVKEEVNSIVEEMMSIKMERLATRQDNSGGASRQAPSINSSFGGTPKVLASSRRSAMVESLTTHQDNSGGASRQAPSINSSLGRTPKVLASNRRSTMVDDEHLIKIKSQLCGESSKLKVISIVGMGGIGKSTLARNIFHDEFIDYHFHCRAWITVSQSYRRRNLLLDIINSLNINKEEFFGVGEEVLEEYIYKHLCGRRYLIIMDDVWDTKVWHDIRMIFPNNGTSGSRIIMTTRLFDLAVYISSHLDFVHQMKFLNEEQSWHLFCEKVFCPPELEDIGRSIAKHCRGLPLAIVLVAGLLSKANMTHYGWEEIASTISSVASANDEHFSEILSLSYNHLPNHLKPCFLYLGGFPEDYEIRISKLIKLWVAEGFLKPIESKSLEEVAEDYLEDLVNRNLVLITKWECSGKFKYCSIHDLLKDLCSERARYEKFHFIYKYDELHEEAIRNSYRLYIHPASSFPKFKRRKYVSNIRSILFFNNAWDHFLPDASKLLRVFEAPDVLFKLFPPEFFELLHLRYLALRHHKFGIPSSISKLQNLQTLILLSNQHDSKQNTSLLSEFWKMPHLRHVMIVFVRLPRMPHDGRIIDGIPLLGMLQTLGTVENFKFTRNTVEMIPSLKKLKIHMRFSRGPKNPWERFGLNNLFHLRQLEKLEIVFDELMIDSDSESETQENFALPENFAFPLSLKQLSLNDTGLLQKDMKAVGLLPNLRVLKLRNESLVGFSDSPWEIIEGEFPELEFLLIDNLNFWLGENMYFPCLERFIIKDSRGSEEIPPAIGDIPTLQLIELTDCSSALESSALRILEEQRDLDNDILEVRIHNQYYRRGEGEESNDEAL